MERREIILGIGILAFLALIISLTLLLGNHFQPQTCGCPHVISNNFVWLFILLAVLFIGSLVYYLLSLKIHAKEDIINKNISTLYSILSKEEKKILDIIIKNKGEVEQSLLADSLGKLKAHRIIRKLEEKQIIDMEKKGRNNIIKLKKELNEELVR